MTDQQIHDLAVGKRGHSITALMERNSRLSRRKNPLFRAWRTATKAERETFMDALQEAISRAERTAAIEDVTQ